MTALRSLSASRTVSGAFAEEVPGAVRMLLGDRSEQVSGLLAAISSDVDLQDATKEDLATVDRCGMPYGLCQASVPLRLRSCSPASGPGYARSLTGS